MYLPCLRLSFYFPFLFFLSYDDGAGGTSCEWVITGAYYVLCQDLSAGCLLQTTSARAQGVNKCMPDCLCVSVGPYKIRSRMNIRVHVPRNKYS
ncbi:hypothetical protein HOY80DRAFT_949807 [Tuber brumale]|nr:hypothetical protein HOY80DRAFT_949807 [Tuber brumale]